MNKNAYTYYIEVFIILGPRVISSITLFIGKEFIEVTFLEETNIQYWLNFGKF